MKPGYGARYIIAHFYKDAGQAVLQVLFLSFMMLFPYVVWSRGA